MKWNSKSIEAKFMFVSRIMIFSFIAFAAGATIVIMTQGPILLVAVLFATGALLFLINSIAPGILIVVGHPNLAYAWRNGRYPLAFSDTPWDLLSSKQRRSVYIEAIISLFVVIAFVIWFISEQ